MYIHRSVSYGPLSLLPDVFSVELRLLHKPVSKMVLILKTGFILRKCTMEFPDNILWTHRVPNETEADNKHAEGCVETC